MENSAMLNPDETNLILLWFEVAMCGQMFQVTGSIWTQTELGSVTLRDLWIDDQRVKRVKKKIIKLSLSLTKVSLSHAEVIVVCDSCHSQQNRPPTQ